MSFVIWYKVEIAEAGSTGGGLAAARSLTGIGLPLTVSNDIFAGSDVLDAEITVTMSEGAAADSFEITLVNLPTSAAAMIRSVQAIRPLNASIHLGYFDEPATTTTSAGKVLLGRITSVDTCVGDDGLARTAIRGKEEGGYRLLNRKAARSQRDQPDPLRFVEDLLAKDPADPAWGDGMRLAQGSTLTGDLTDFTIRSTSAMEALRQLADRANAPLVVRDGTVFLGAAVGAAPDRAPVVFDPETNVVSLSGANVEDTASRKSVRDVLDLTVLGHPGLRVGQVATINGLSDVPTGPLRLSRVVHRFSTSGGYTADVGLIASGAGQRATVAVGVRLAVDRVRETIDRVGDDRPAIDMGEITEYAAGAEGKHRASLHYAQTPDPAVDAPSMASPIDSTVDLHGTPIASPFAFDRTGLIVPVYPKMRALLAHNRGLVNDAVVGGFVWPENPLLRRPANNPGDYWLALPTRLGDDGLPQGAGANDLTDASGNRVIQAAGLNIMVGVDALPEVGARPDPPSDASITIEHQSGTTIKVDPSGAVTITTDHQAITLTNGQVKLALDGDSVAVS